MNPIHEDTHTMGSEERFDRLVDGELSEDARRELLSGLDHEAGGWRQCALAFLEAQCWKQEMGAMARPAPEQPAATPPRPRSRWRDRAMTAAALAACFLIALALGTRLQIRVGPGGQSPLTEVAGDPQAPLHGPAPQGAVPVRTTPRGLEMVSFTVPGGAPGQSRTVRLPAVEQEFLNQEWLESVPVSVAPDVRQRLRELGHEVQVRRQLVPVQINGRQFVVPVDHLEIHVVRRPAL